MIPFLTLMLLTVTPYETIFCKQFTTAANLERTYYFKCTKTIRTRLKSYYAHILHRFKKRTRERLQLKFSNRKQYLTVGCMKSITKYVESNTRIY